MWYEGRSSLLVGGEGVPYAIAEYVFSRFARVIDERGDETLVPGWQFSEEVHVSEYSTFEIILGKWFTRLRMSGHYGCTEWVGPFDSKEEAMEHVEYTFDIDPSCECEVNPKTGLPISNI
jgi:hypothetical protein